MKLYQIVEQGKGIRETYTMGFETEKELSKYLNGKQEMIGYVPGLGGDKTYSIVAWYIGEHGEAYINIEKYWRMADIHKSLAA